MAGSNDCRIAIHHVGARDGSRSFPALPRFEGDFVNVLYEADEDCVEEVRRNGEKLASELHVLPYCVAGASGPVTFNINKDPYTSSCLEPEPWTYSLYRCYGRADYILGEVTKPVEKRELHAETMDRILQHEGGKIPAPDFLSLDAQGAEYEILTGAEGVLDTDVLAMIVELSFCPVYKNQKLFYEIGQYLYDKGFIFVDFQGHLQQKYSLYREPVGLRSPGFLVNEDGLFFRRIDKLVNMGLDAGELAVKLRKLAFIAVVFNQFEYGLQCLKQAQAVCPDAEPGAACAYWAFLDQLHELSRTMPRLFPTVFDPAYEYSRKPSSSFKKKAERWLVKFARRLYGKTPVELLLIEYGLGIQAYWLNRLRWEQKIMAHELVGEGESGAMAVSG